MSGRIVRRDTTVSQKASRGVTNRETDVGRLVAHNDERVWVHDTATVSRLEPHEAVRGPGAPCIVSQYDVPSAVAT